MPGIARYQHRGGAAETRLDAPIAPATLSFTVQTGGGATYPDGSVGPFWVVLDRGQNVEEMVLCASRTSDTFTVAASGRGADNTTASSHGASATVNHAVAAVEVDDMNRLLSRADTKGKLLIADGTDMIALAAPANNTVLIGDTSTATGYRTALVDVAQLNSAAVTTVKIADSNAVSYTHLTLPTNREV